MRESLPIIEGLSDRLQAVREAVARAARQAGRSPDDIRIIAVSKTVPAEAIRAAHAAGQADFGESYVQEALAKMDALQDLPITWHFIGPLQSNKTRLVAERFDWVHSVDRARIAERLAAQRPEALPPLQVCLQVNVSGEATKSGVGPDEVIALANVVSGLDRLRLRGLMAIPEPTDDVSLQHVRFATVRDLAGRLRAAGLPLDTLSMGMSDDLDAAVAEGATMVRVGRAIFGARPPAA